MRITREFETPDVDQLLADARCLPCATAVLLAAEIRSRAGGRP